MSASETKWTAGGACCGCLKQHTVEFLLSIVALAIGIAAFELMGETVESSAFVERDPSLSFPLLDPNLQTVSGGSLLVFAVIPLVILPVLQCIGRLVLRKRAESWQANRFVNDLALGFLAPIQAAALNMCVTQFTKVYVAKKRPNFFAICNYRGVARAALSFDTTEEDVQAYLNVTEAGRPGDISLCAEKNPTVLAEAQFSFPSGHSSMTFAALSLVFFFTYALVRSTTIGRNGSVLHRYARSWPVLVALPTVVLAFGVAISRVRDGYHDATDILAGSLIGLFSAALIFHVHFGGDDADAGGDGPGALAANQEGTSEMRKSSTKRRKGNRSADKLPIVE